MSTSDIQYGIKIITDDGTGTVIGSTDKTIGLIAGVFYMVTGQPGYTGLSGAPVPSGDTSQHEWIEGIIDRHGLGDLTLEIQLDTPNLYGSASDFEFTLRNANTATTGFFQRAKELGITFTGRSVTAYVIEDGVFKQAWTGIIQSDPFTEDDYKFSCMDSFVSLHKDFPSGNDNTSRSPSFNNLEFPNIDPQLNGTFIPVTLGTVNYALGIDTETQVPVSGHQGVILTRSRYNDDPNNNGSGNDYIDVTKVIHYLYTIDGETIVSQIKLATEYMDSTTSTDINYKFQANDARLVGKYMYFIRGSDSPACRIIGNLVTTGTGTSCNTYVLLEQRVTPIAGEGDSADTPPFTYVQVMDKINNYVVSRNQIGSFDTIHDVDGDAVDVGKRVVSDSGLESHGLKLYQDVTAACNDFDVDGNASGDIDPFTKLPVTSTDRAAFKVAPTHLDNEGKLAIYHYFDLASGTASIKFLGCEEAENTSNKQITSVKYEDGTTASSGDDVSSRMTDRSHATYIEAIVDNQSPDTSPYGLVFTFELHLPDIGEKDISPLYLSFDSSFLTPGFTDLGTMQVFVGMYGSDMESNASPYFIGDADDLSESSKYLYVKENLPINSTFYPKFIPGQYYGSIGGDALFQNKKTLLDISSYVKNNKDGRVWRRVYLQVEFVLSTVSASHKLRIDQIALFSEPKIDPESSKIWTRVQGEKAVGTWGGRVANGDPVFGPSKIIEHIMRQYDQITTAQIDTDSFDAVHSSKNGLIIGKQIDSSESSFSVIKDILCQTMCAIVPMTNGKRRIVDWMTNYYNSHTHDSTNILKGSITGLQKTSIGDIFNQFSFEYGVEPLNSLPKGKLLIQRLDQASFPATSSESYTSGIVKWNTFSYGFNDFTNAGTMWQACKNSIKENLMSRSAVAPDNITKLTWFQDPVDLGLETNDTITDSANPAYNIARYHVTWWTKQKYVIPYSLAINSDNLGIELLDQVNFTDDVIDPGDYAGSWVTKKTISPSTNTIKLEVMFYPGSYPSL